MSDFLLDTHTFLWLTVLPERLPPAVQVAAGDPRNGVFVSAASAYEIALKNRTGKLPGVEGLIADYPAKLAELSFQQLEITTRHAIVAGGLDLRHKDPFDRLLIAQALVEGLTLLSNEKLFDSFGVRRIW